MTLKHCGFEGRFFKSVCKVLQGGKKSWNLASGRASGRALCNLTSCVVQSHVVFLNPGQDVRHFTVWVYILQPTSESPFVHSSIHTTWK